MSSAYKSKSAAAKPPIMAKISKFISKAFKILRTIAQIIYRVIEETFRLITFLFNLLVKLISHPATPCVLAILAFVAVSMITLHQWLGIGLWIGSLLGIKGVGGVSASLAGGLFGFGLNVFQMSPMMWKIKKEAAKAFLVLGVDIDGGTEANTPQERLGAWLSADYGLMKKMRQTSYIVEVVLMAAYCFMGSGLDFFVILQGIMSLILPEKCLQLAASTISFYGSVQEQMAREAENTEPEDDVSFS